MPMSACLRQAATTPGTNLRSGITVRYYDDFRTLPSLLKTFTLEESVKEFTLSPAAGNTCRPSGRKIGCSFGLRLAQEAQGPSPPIPSWGALLNSRGIHEGTTREQSASNETVKNGPPAAGLHEIPEASGLHWPAGLDDWKLQPCLLSRVNG